MMYKREDYWPHMVGLFFVSLVVNPFLWRFTIISDSYNIEYDRLLIASAMYSGVFAFAYSRELKFSIFRLLGGILILGFLALKAFSSWWGSSGYNPIIVIFPGAVSFIIMGGGGWLGVQIGRRTGWTESLRVSREDLPVYDEEHKSITKEEANTFHSANQIERNETETQIEEGYRGLSDRTYQKLLTITHEAWRSGSLSHFNNEFQNIAIKKNITDFMESFNPSTEAIHFAFLKYPPLADEFIIYAENEFGGLGYVLTNRYLYFFGLDDSILANKYEHGKVALSSIKKCDYKEGLARTKATLTLKSGKELFLKDIYKLDFLQYIKQHERGERAESDGESPMYRFLFHSYESQRNGLFDQLGDSFKSNATKYPSDILANSLLNDQPYETFLKKCFKIRVPETDEFLVELYPKSFLLTNKCLYIYTSLKQDVLHTMHICEIPSYEIGGLLRKSGTLTLNNGKVIKFKRDEVPDEKIVRQLQEMLNCVDLIDT